jgi:alanyl-tRNA synthetase
VVALTPKLIKKGFDATKIIKDLGPIIGGGGRGRPDFAQAGGKKPEKIEEALKKAEEIFDETIRS